MGKLSGLNESIKMNSTLLGIVLMSVGVFFIPFVDGIAKYLSSDLSPLFISWARYASGLVFILPITVWRYKGKILPTEKLGLQSLRTLLLITAMTCFFVGIATVPLAEATAAYFVAPFVATLFSALLLGEVLTKPKILSVVVGFVGVLFVVRPSNIPDAGILFALAAGILFGLYMIASRALGSSSSPTVTLNFQYILGAVVLLPLALFEWQWPSINLLLIIFAMGTLSLCCHILTIIAFQLTEASLLSPFLYIEMIGAVIIGYLFFEDLPSVLTWVGIIIIIVSGLCLIGKRKAAVKQ